LNNEHCRREYDLKINSYIGDVLVNDDLFSVETICKIICELKTGKACGLDGLMVEHLLHCHPAVHLIVTYLLNLMLMAGHIPTQFTVGLTFPIEKSTIYSRMPNVDDFRGITISPLLSKILEKCVLDKFGKYFESSINQFGFKKNIGCQHAIYALRSTVDYFVNRSTTVNICSLDVAKAFDRINHYRLYIKLMERFVPLNIIMLLIDMYKFSTAVVNWNGCMSLPYQIFAGVRQGGSISPAIFAVYVNSVIEKLKQHDLGCSMGHTYLGVIMYADDLLLVSGSICNLQKMIDQCLLEFSSLDLNINAKKSVCVRIGQRHNAECTRISVGGTQISWSTSFRYLGVTIRSGSAFTVDCKPVRAKFYRSFNSLFSKIPKADEHIIVSLVKTYCISLVLYSLEAVCLNRSSLNQLDSMLINAFGKIFKSFERSILLHCMYLHELFAIVIVVL